MVVSKLPLTINKFPHLIIFMHTLISAAIIKINNDYKLEDFRIRMMIQMMKIIIMMTNDK